MSRDHTRVRALAALLAGLLLATSIGISTAARAETPAAERAATDDEAPRDPDTPPSLRLDDRKAPGPVATVEAEPRPFWKSPIFWTIVGALVVGGVVLATYSASGSGGDVEPCPNNIATSLGCFGAGSNR